jgi:hypothetical protein
MTKTTMTTAIAAVALALVVVLWWALPEYRKARADALVSSLCEKDGGLHVYTVVKLPPSRFNNRGRPFFPGRGVLPPDQRQTKPGDDFYYIEDKAAIVPEASFRPAVWRSHVRLLRAADNRVVSEGVFYLRRGGDPIGPWHPTAFYCPKDADITSLVAKTFIKE